MNAWFTGHGANVCMLVMHGVLPFLLWALREEGGGKWWGKGQNERADGREGRRMEGGRERGRERVVEIPGLCVSCR